MDKIFPATSDSITVLYASFSAHEVLKKNVNTHNEHFLALYHIYVYKPMETNELPLTRRMDFIQATSNVQPAAQDTTVDMLADNKIGATYWLA